jgi:hypothetical protein
MMSCSVHCKKRFSIFPSSAGMSITKLFLIGINKLFPHKGNLVSDIPGTGYWQTFFYSVLLSLESR